MSLDDIIKKNKQSQRNSNVARRGRGNGFRKNDGQTRRRTRFDQGDDGRKPSFGNNRGSIRKRGGYRRYNNFNKNENSYGQGIKRGRLRDRINNRRNFNRENNETSDTSNYRRLFVSNLHKDIINSELKTIFSKIGPLKRCGIHWDNLGNSKGTADIEYERADDAKAAIKEFNDIEIEGVALKVTYSTKGRGGRLRRRLGTRRPNGRNNKSNYNK